jgi:hypothetical protein
MIEDENLNWQSFPDLPTHNFYSQVMTIDFLGITFQSECDWCIGMRQQQKTPSVLLSKSKEHLVFGDLTILPKTIFVNLKHGNLNIFIDNILPHISFDHKFILILGDSDITFPNQIDQRFPLKYGRYSLSIYNKLMDDHRIVHIFCANLDIPRNEKISPLPVGFDFSSFQPNSYDNFNLDINSKELKMFHCDRVRQGIQWEDRRIIKRICSNEWSAFSVSCERELDINDFNMYLNETCFMLCPHGGGLEPNPKIFHALLVGSIPIVKKFVNCEFLYQDLPIVFIDDWKSEYVTAEKLKIWRESFKDYFYNQDKRKQVLYKLTTDYWKKYIQKQSNADFQIFS